MNKGLQQLSRAILSLSLLAGATTFVATTPVWAQTNISGDVTGTVTDTSGAVISGADVEVKNVAQGTTKTTKTNSSGQYRIPLLTPGAYTMSVTSPNFSSSEEKLTISQGVITSKNFKLSIGSQSTTIEVSSDAQLLHTDDAQISTTYSYAQVQSLPNPGNDLTFIAQTAPGSVMNTQGGYGNFSSFGLPATSNTVTTNGGYDNDPFLNLTNSGATNLLLGNNDIDTVTVVSPAYGAAYGGLAGAQISEISRSGANSVHGNLTYQWNGSALNANSWFNNNAGDPKGRSNSNQWAAAIGGPIKKDKAFFFINTEGLRVVIPVRTTVYAPSSAWQSDILYPTAKTTALVPYGNLAANGNSAEAPLYQTMFDYYNNAPGAQNQIPSTSGDPRFVQYNAQTTNFAQEWIITGRFDINLSSKDKLFVHYKQDKGIQPTQTNVLSPLFNANSPQPSYEGQLNWTRSISPNITNQFVLTGSYYRAIFSNTNAAEANASVPFVLTNYDGDWANNVLGTSNIGGANYAFPQGRLVTGYQAVDDLTINKGKHTFTMGYSLRRNLVTDYGLSEYTTPREESLDSSDFAAGYSDLWVQRFPTSLTEPLAVYNMGAYFQDQWKVAPNLTLTAGIRFEHNANPTCAKSCFSNLSGQFSGLPTTSTTPYNQLFSSGRKQAFLNQQAVGINPRIGFAYLPNSKTTIRGGFGLFTDTFPAQIASDLDSNAPNVARFSIQGAAYGNNYALDPALDSSAGVVAANSATAFQSAYAAGGSYTSIYNATGGKFARPSFIATQPKVFMPTTEIWSLAVERQLDSKTVVSATYVGNHTYHGAVLNAGLNAFGDVSGLPTSRPNSSLNVVSIYNSANQANYNGVVITANRHQNWLTLGFNYTWSHALDLVSNGGFNAFGNNPIGQLNPYNLSQNYGNADYNVKNYISANYIIDIPASRGPRVLVKGWQVAGTVFHSSGLPFSVVDGNTVPSGYSGTLFADQLNNNFSHNCGGSTHAGANGTPCDFGAAGSSSAGFASFDNATSFGTQGRNTLVGPGYTDTDLTLTKSFDIPLHEAKLKVGAQFFNILNHPNFAIPSNDVAAGAGTTGLIQSTVSTPTSILGSFLGGDASPRLIQLVGKINF
ncbi:MAG: carboxypeptidase regulatory-like domain-containing protein [Edaphobacter sp.]|uniref:carboxypeptidase regulatory-like domain-containing protein n=1 Tax=Edaphobacter sp. TaxID=1934404 RepID=UPI002395C24D|nr:carboxypeptidase regulatory-like domain-containing protein [Edaphobacter sp.]MDE1177053.1 carboxypeptidase regulatory-like domain-containing protein [Edaphobacter sp.]